MRLAGRSVLVVDDEPILSATFAVLLEREGAVVHAAADGRAALQMLGQHTVDIILCDQQMPVMDGITLLRTMCDRGIRIPVVLFISGMGTDVDERSYSELGVLATLTKPVRPEELSRCLESVLARV